MLHRLIPLLGIRLRSHGQASEVQCQRPGVQAGPRCWLCPAGHTRLAGTGPTVPSSPPCCRLLPSCSRLANSNLDTSPAAGKACQPQQRHQRVPGVPGAPSWAAVRLFARCSKVSGDFFPGEVGGWMLNAALTQSCCSTVNPSCRACSPSAFELRAPAAPPDSPPHG